MGFDLYGLNPKQNTETPTILNVDKPSWELEESERKSYWEAKDKYQDENPGIYFATNVWGWRPIWEFVCNVCDNILTEKDIHGGQFNGGHKISKTKAIKIANRIKKLAPRLTCFVVYGQNPNSGTTNMAGAVDVANQIKKNKIKTTKKVNAAKEWNETWQTAIQQDPRLRDWTDAYPFNRDLILKFAKFCEQSGGFTIC